MVFPSLVNPQFSFSCSLRTSITGCTLWGNSEKKPRCFCENCKSSSKRDGLVLLGKRQGLSSRERLLGRAQGLSESKKKSEVKKK